MTIEVKVPVLPESVEDATIATWHKKAGDTIRRDENLVDLETDKVVLEVPAPADGKIVELRGAEGDTVNSDDVIAVIEEGAVADEPEVAEPEDEPKDEAKKQAAAAEPEPKASAPKKAQAADTRPSPSARRVAAEGQVDTAGVEGTGGGDESQVREGSAARYRRRRACRRPRAGSRPSRARRPPPAGCHSPVPGTAPRRRGRAGRGHDAGAWRPARRRR